MRPIESESFGTGDSHAGGGSACLKPELAGRLRRTRTNFSTVCQPACARNVSGLEIENGW